MVTTELNRLLEVLQILEQRQKNSDDVEVRIFCIIVALVKLRTRIGHYFVFISL